MPCVYSCRMIPLSRSPSRMPGCVALLRSVPVLGPAASAALIVLPSACVTATAGIAGEAATIEPVRVGAAPLALWATTSALAPSDSATCSRCRYEHCAAAVPPSATAIQLPVGRGVGYDAAVQPVPPA